MGGLGVGVAGGPEHPDKDLGTPVGANWGTDDQELNIIFININELTLLFGGEDGSQQDREIFSWVASVAAARPVHPLGKCLASVQLLAWVLVAKYADALPLYRLEGILKRHGGRWVLVASTAVPRWRTGSSAWMTCSSP